MMRRRLAAWPLATALIAGGALGQTPPRPEDTAGWVRKAMTALCRQTPLSLQDAQAALPGATLMQTEPPTPGPRMRRRFALPGGDILQVEHFRPGGRLRRFSAAYFARRSDQTADAPTPLLQGLASGDCVPRSGRRIRLAGPDHSFLDQLDGDLETLRWSETLEAPWPQGRDPGGPRVALIDSGLPYDLPIFKDRLARDAAGRPLGYDFWDLDPHPYDADTSRGPFLPIRHGGPVASILVREAPTAALIPYRYPRPDMSRMGALVERAAKAGARIIAAPLGSGRKEDWRAFEAALRAHPQILAIVSAGNNGRDIDAAPIWPAALDLPNIVTVTSADAFGGLARGSNWGAESVDLMLPAENQPVIDFRGAKGRASGSSYAVPRLAALAARILARRPTLTTDELKQALFARAAPSPYAPGKLKIGWLPDPAAPLD